MSQPPAADQATNTDHQEIILSMYEKGRSFVMAGGLVKAYEGHEFVYFHLLCQGLECIGKAILLKHDYQKYHSNLKKIFGHNLETLISEVNIISQAALISDDALQELKQLNNFYQKHILRYGNTSSRIKDLSQLSASFLHRDLVDCLIALNDQFTAHE